MTRAGDAGLAHRERRGDPIGVVVLVGAFLLVVMVGTSEGGYHPTAWGWMRLAFAWVGALALLLTPRLTFGRLELAFVTSLSLVIGWTALSTPERAGSQAPCTRRVCRFAHPRRARGSSRGCHLSGALAAMLLVRSRSGWS